MFTEFGDLWSSGGIPINIEVHNLGAKKMHVLYGIFSCAYIYMYLLVCVQWHACRTVIKRNPHENG